MSQSGWQAVDDTVGWEPVENQPKPPVATLTPPAPGFSERHPLLTSAANTVANLGEGASRGLENTLGGIERFAEQPAPTDRASRSLLYRALHPMVPQVLQIKSQPPEGTAQKIGYGAEQAAEFLAPGGLEKKGAEEVAAHLPMLGKLAEPAARIGTSALSSGLVNKAQGGSFTGGSLTGGGFGAAGEAARSVAPSLAESALGVTRRMRGFGKTPGAAALGEIKGIKPTTVAANSQEKLSQLTSELESLTANSKVPASTDPAIKVIDGEQMKAIKQNNRVKYQMLHDIREQLTKEFSTGNPIPNKVPASKILDLKRGIGDLETTWNPEQRGGMKPVIRQVYNALDKELDRTVPGADKINQRISSLIPVAQRAESQGRGAEMSQRIAHRLAAHTGSLAGTGMGSYFGYREGGPKGALIGGTVGLAVPELLASPTVQMMGARALKSPTSARLGRAGASLLLPRSKDAEKPQQK